jgi:hypothetical protein
MSAALQAAQFKQKSATTGGVAVVVAADYGSGGYLEDAGASDSTIYKLWLRTATGSITIGPSGESTNRSKLIQVQNSDQEIGYFRRSDLENLYLYNPGASGTVTVYINAAKVVKIW